MKENMKHFQRTDMSPSIRIVTPVYAKASKAS
jgi:hypothetical protein